MDKRLSVIVPVYNVEKYLEECVNSIACQIDNTCEIILVDDGSKDSSGSIADSLHEANALIKVIHKENGGLSSARNAGLEIAVGKYVVFIDSDDRIAPNSLLPILEYSQNNDYDLCFLKAIKFYPDGQIVDMFDHIYADNFSNNRESNIKYLSSRPKFSGSACTKIYKLDFLKNNRLHFPYDRRLSEDLGFVLQCIYKSNNIGSYDGEFYEYRQDREGSITSSQTARTFDGLHLFISESCNMFCQNRKPRGITEKYLMSFVAYEFAVLMYNNASGGFVDNDFIRQYKWVLRFGRSKRGKLIYSICNLLGTKNTSKLLARVKS